MSLSTTELHGRQDVLDGLDEYIDTCQNDITNMLDTLDWTPEHFMEPKSVCTCPHDEGHKMSVASLEKHTPVCHLMKQGCTRADAEKKLEDTSYFYENSSCVYTVKIDKEMLNSVLWNHHVQNHSVFHGIQEMPLTPAHEEQLLSREDRLGLAEYIVNRAKEANRLKELGRDELQVAENLADLVKKDDDERHLDVVEEMAALRDYRRRRQTYRAKNVHITKKSHTEIMREVITNQMEMYSKSIQDQLPQEDTSVEREYEEGEYKEDSTSKNRSGRGDRANSKYDREERKDRYSHRDRHRSRSRSRIRSRSKDRGRSRDKSRSRRSKSRSRSRETARESEKKQDRERKRSKSKERLKHKRKDKHRSRSKSRDRSKKSKHKKRKHKHRHHSSERSSRSVEREPPSGADIKVEVKTEPDCIPDHQTDTTT